MKLGYKASAEQFAPRELVVSHEGGHAPSSLVTTRPPDALRRGKGLISSYWQKDWAKAHWDDSDDDIIGAALPGIDTLLPGSVGELSTVHVQRWKHALVTGPVSRYRDLERFKSLTPTTSRVRFAGDSMSSSTMNSCLCSGERAADEVVTAVAG